AAGEEDLGEDAVRSLADLLYGRIDVQQLFVGLEGLAHAVSPAVGRRVGPPRIVDVLEVRGPPALGHPGLLVVIRVDRLGHHLERPAHDLGVVARHVTEYPGSAGRPSTMDPDE